MKESIGGTQIFLIVITLILIFAAIMSYTINHSNAFSVKDQIITIIENAGGLNFDDAEGLDDTPESLRNKDQQTIQDIVDVINLNSYRATGDCNMGKTGKGYEVAAYRRDGTRTDDETNASFCIIKYKAGDEAADASSGALDAYHYQVVVFYSLDIPILNQILNFRALGQTKILFR